MNSYRPLLAITMGDPAGAGPEIVVKSLALPEVHQLCRGLVIGDAEAMRAAADIVGIPMSVNAIASPGEMQDDTKVLNVLDQKTVDVDTLVRLSLIHI